MARVVSICLDNQKGVKTEPIIEGIFKYEFGLLRDTHTHSHTHCHISPLAIESTDKMRNLIFDVNLGDFTENFTTEGIGLFSLSPGTRSSIGDDITQSLLKSGMNAIRLRYILPDWQAYHAQEKLIHQGNSGSHSRE